MRMKVGARERKEKCWAFRF